MVVPTLKKSEDTTTRPGYFLATVLGPLNFRAVHARMLKAENLKRDLEGMLDLPFLALVYAKSMQSAVSTRFHVDDLKIYCRLYQVSSPRVYLHTLLVVRMIWRSQCL